MAFNPLTMFTKRSVVWFKFDHDVVYTDDVKISVEPINFDAIKLFRSNWSDSWKQEQS